jgi:hypothetical protein
MLAEILRPPVRGARSAEEEQRTKEYVLPIRQRRRRRIDKGRVHRDAESED